MAVAIVFWYYTPSIAAATCLPELLFFGSVMVELCDDVEVRLVRKRKVQVVRHRYYVIAR
jgi:hypothetical protein